MMLARKSKSLIAAKTVIGQEISKIKQVWIQALCPTIISTALYFIVFGQLIGAHTKIIHHLTYLEFITPGLMMMAMIIAAYDASVSTIFLSRYNKSIEEILVSSMSVRNMVFSQMIAGMLRGVLIGLIVFIISLFFVKFYIKNIMLVIITSILSCLVFSLIGMMTGVYIKGFDQISVIPLFFIRPLSYLGGLFYPLAHLPIFWYKLALFNPLVYLIDGYRQLFFYQVDSFSAVLWLVLTLFLLSSLLYYLTYLLIKNKCNLIR
ncbi:Inner membrane transport permease YadH [Piscirickettsia salmonis]|uniref:ABC transporter permease n=1 Tax=Piscirickettsia salmonis TaxID=1238 RepID=UPI0012B9B694|nr:ABC transporter permease [Piscirickettsia salmonis]QGP49245.1 Inner membrane transport permease YadH [Piscirickettsia salmonis]QGP55935.1 Inner membrane transport permease YadH [Piscirickettsia salmonis]QGP58195.1 Inner membrane transport permease YadH [Piscirickettsia salmonis]QGP65504.1 Inner membrane transport permease YadH [Piscirickettsia salmonis]